MFNNHLEKRTNQHESIDIEGPNSLSSAFSTSSRSTTPLGGYRPASPPLKVGLSAAHRSRRRRNFFCLGFAVIAGLILFSAGAFSTPEQKAHLVKSQQAAAQVLSGVFQNLAPFGQSGQQTQVHPILVLLQRARQKHTALINQQSRTLSKAKSTYKTRYGQDPPAGFDKWYEFAEARNHTLVDEYDQLMNDLRPFAELPADVLKARTKTLSLIPGVSIITIKDGKSQVNSKSGRWAPALALQEMIAPFVKELPDMELAINERPEGRILPEIKQTVPVDEWGIVESDLIKNNTDPLTSQLPFSLEWKPEGDRFLLGTTWEVFKRACAPDSASRRLVTSLRAAESEDRNRQQRLASEEAIQALEPQVLTDHNNVVYGGSTSRRRPKNGASMPPIRELTFSATANTFAEICRNPSLHTFHSAFFTNTRSIPYLYPLFSPSKPAGFADLLIPSHHYWSPSSEFTYDWELKKGRTKTTADVPWAEKDSTIFWRGKVTKGAETPPGHQPHFQKQRLVALANDDGRQAPGTKISRADRKAGNNPLIVPIEESRQPRRTLVSLDASNGSLLSLNAPLGRVNNLTMDVALACDPKLNECKMIQKQGYRVEPPGPLSEAWKHKLLIDLDEVGLSPKFLALMESRCAVMKATVQKEFWNNWAVPWYHYIPLSTSYSEIQNIQAFFTGFPKELTAIAKNTTAEEEEAAALLASALLEANGKNGKAKKKPQKGKITASLNMTQQQAQPVLVPLTPQSEPVYSVDPLAEEGTLFDPDRALRDIALAGSRWKRRNVRKEDLEVYVYRLLVEYGALWNTNA